MSLLAFIIYLFVGVAATLIFRRDHRISLLDIVVGAMAAPFTVMLVIFEVLHTVTIAGGKRDEP